MSHGDVLFTSRDIQIAAMNLIPRIQTMLGRRTTTYIVLRRGGEPWGSAVCEHAAAPRDIQYLAPRSYCTGKRTPDSVTFVLDEQHYNTVDHLAKPIADRVVILDDMLDTGATMAAVVNLIHGVRPDIQIVAAPMIMRWPTLRPQEGIRTVLLLNRPKYGGNVVPSFLVGPGAFLVGYGMDDTDGTLRDLPYVAVAADKPKG